MHNQLSITSFQVLTLHFLLFMLIKKNPVFCTVHLLVCYYKRELIVPNLKKRELTR